MTRSLAIVWTALVALAACAPLPVRPDRPRASVREGRLEVAPDGALLVHLQVDVVNPNSRALTLRALDWEISVDDRARARGRSEIDATVAARASRPIALDARVPPGAAARILASPELAGVRLDGVLHFFSSGGDVASTIQWEIRR